jgi:hypothetical protein
MTMAELKEVNTSFCSSAAGIDFASLKAVEFVFRSIQSDFIFFD